MRREVEMKRLKLSLTEGGKKWKSRVIASCSDLEYKFQVRSKREGADLATSVETLGDILRTRTLQHDQRRQDSCPQEVWNRNLKPH